jgi:hypothetical protein
MMWAGTQGWVTNGDEKAARDAAVALIRLAYVFPTLDVSRSLQAVAAHSLWSNIWFGRHRNTSTYVYGNYTAYHNPLYAYDALFDYIRGNQDLAESVSRFVPWVRTPDDLIRLIDVYLVQTTVKRVLRYQWYGSGREPERISEIASLVGNAAATEPWMNWLFSRVFFYPGALGGIQDIIIRGTDRDGRSPIGSFNYMMGEFSADKVAEKLECYIIGGGNPKYDLRDSRRYPKVVSALEFDHRVRTAGIGFPRLGSSSGPDHTSLSGFLPDRAVTGWRWTHDPQFAYVVKHYVGRRDQTDTEWQAIETAAATVSRAPWFENRSRILPNLMVLLETGLAHDDLRFRRSVGVRIGLGQGHHHEDTLDLEMYAHGLPMVLDSGQRRDTAYSTPKDTRSIVHNTVVVDGKNWMGYSWARTVTDAENARYLCAQAVPLNGTRLFRRQVALVDVDEGSYGPDGHSKLGPAQFSPALTSAMPTVVATPSSYVFDVFRVSGGNEHTYCFHGLVTDPAGPQPQTNIETTPISASATSDDKTYRRAAAWLADFKNEKYFATAQAEVQFTFPFPRERPTQTHPFAAVGTEKLLLGAAFDAALPLKFTRLRLLGTDGALAMKGDQHCSRYEHCLPNVFVQRQGQDLESAFCAVIEPYAGTPFIASAQRLAIADNETDARQAVAAALEITTDDRVGRAARRDVCFADGRPEKVRRVQGSGFMLDVAAEFAYLSIDAQGLRQATLSGGTLLDAPGVRIEAATRDRRATVTRADYLAKTVWIDQTWPVWTASARLVELGSLPESGQPGYVTSEMATSARREGAATVLTLLRGADYYRAPITAVDAATGMVVCSGEMPFSAVERSGLLHGFVASNDAQTRFWRADVLPEDKAQARFPFQLRAMTGPPGTAAQAGAVVAADDFGQESVLRLWEYGVGDTVRMNTSVNLRRIGTGEYQVWADVDVVVTVAGKAWSFRAEGLSSAGGSARFRVTP